MFFEKYAVIHTTNREKKKGVNTMTKIDISKAYQFLASFGDVNAWKEQADGCGTNGKKDGTVIKSEFRAFMKENFASWNGESNTVKEVNDLVDRFWNKIDTNTSEKKIAGTSYKDLNGLNNDEVEALGNKLELYVAFDNYMSKISAPKVLTTQAMQWKKDVRDSLSVSLEDYIKQGGSKDGLEAYLEQIRPTIENKATANCCAKEYQDSLASGILKDYKDFDIRSDEDLQNIINKYLESVGTDKTPEQIQKDIKAILDGYLATAGIGNGNSDILGDYGYSQNEDERLNAIQSEKVKKDLLNSVKNSDYYKKYPEDFTKLIENFVKSLTVEDIEGDITELFTSSTKYKNFEKQCQVYDLFADDNTDWAAAIKYGNFSENLQNVLGDEVSKLPINDTIIKAAVAQVLNGNFVNSDGSIDTESLKQWALEQFIVELAKKTHSEYSKAELEDLYYKSAEIDPSIENKRASALATCESLAKFGTKHAECVADYIDNIKNAERSSTINANMKALFAAIKKVKETTNTDGSNGSSDSASAKADIKDILKSSSSKSTSCWGGQTTEHLESLGYNHGGQITESSFTDLYNNGAIIQLHYGKGKDQIGDNATSTVRTRLVQLGNLVKSALSSAGVKDSDILDEAVNSVINSYISSSMKSYNASRDRKWGHNNGWQDGLRKKTEIAFDREGASSVHGIVKVYDDTGKNTALYSVSFKNFVDDVLAKYNELIGAEDNDSSE